MTIILTIWRFLGVRGAIAAGLGLALAFTMWRADSLSGQLEQAKAATVAEATRHAVTRSSVANLEAAMARVMDEARLRETALHNAERQAARDTAENDRAARTTQATIDRLRAIASTPPEVPCEVDMELRSLAEGL